jgi:hypothetical protein
MEDERRFLLECEEYQERPTAVWRLVERVGEWHTTDRSNGPRPAATIFDAHRLSAEEQFTLLIGGGHPGIVDASGTRRVMSRIMIEIGESAQMRASYMTT